MNVTYAQGIGAPVLADLTTTPFGWTAFAACAEADPEVFFPGKGESMGPAKRVCGGCEVRVECLEYAVANPALEGVWGGTSERERQRIRADRGLPEPADDDDVKPCVGCHEVKVLTEFNVDRSAPDGRKYRCRACTAAQCRLSKQRRQEAA